MDRMPLSDSERNSRIGSLVQAYLPQIREAHVANDRLDYYVSVGPSYYNDNFHREPIRAILKKNTVLRSLMIGRGVDSKRLDELGYSNVENLARRFIEPSRLQKWRDARRDRKDAPSYRSDMYAKVMEFNGDNKDYFGGLCSELNIESSDIGMPSWRDVDRSKMDEKDYMTFNVTYEKWIRRLTEPVELKVVSSDSDLKEETAELGPDTPVYKKEGWSLSHSLVSSNFALGILDLLSPERTVFYPTDMKKVFDSNFEEWSLGGVSKEDVNFLSRLYEDLQPLSLAPIHTTDTLVLRLLFAASKLRKYAERRSG